MTEAGSEYLASTVAQYETRVTPFSPAGAGQWEQILNPDSRRWYVLFESATGGTNMPMVVGGDQAPPFTFVGNVPSPKEHKLRDAPSLVSGKWWCQGALGSILLITECLYVGG